MHIPVLLKESIEQLNPKAGDTIVDGTINGGGHSEEILKIIGNNGMLVGIDQDDEVLNKLREKWKDRKNVLLVKGNFRNMDKVLETLKIEKVNGVLLDIGVSSSQIDESGRGFSFKKDEPLLMTMKTGVGEDELTAKEIVNNWGEKELADAIWQYGEERFSRRIAKNIARRREIKPIETTFELVDVIRESVPGVYRNSHRINCATRTFQALRIEVNDELGALKEGLEKATDRLADGGRLAVISFHSLEDRIVKNYFKEMSAKGEGKIITKKPIVPTEEEIKNNSRSRSAKLRLMEKIKNNDKNN
ncbi:MAG: 16S rRNA (cytosine(1402)-N(4))-methyltransferase RsmH [Patescibacteria group bacterium]|mgnify:FL=1